MITKSIINLIFNNIEIKEDKFNIEYEGFTFTFNSKIYHSRLAKKTPKKEGYFFAFWKKTDNKNQPYDINDQFDYLIINVIDEKNKGYYIFSKEDLIINKIISSDYKLGKMALRVYPYWITNLNKTALKTQQWQQKFFFTYK